MGDYSILSLTANGAGLQAYFRTAFVEDSQFPRLDDGDRVLAQPTEGGGLLLLPVESLDAYPIAVDGPPDGLVADVADGADVRSPDGDLCAAATTALHSQTSPDHAAAAAAETADTDTHEATHEPTTE